MIARLYDSEVEGAGPYLRGVETCFPNWGGQPLFDWAFRRRCAGGVARLMVVEVGGAPIAGCGLIDRMVRTADGGSGRVSALAGAWTLPAARGAGAFTRIVDFASELASESGADSVVAFVHRDNASTRRLAAAGAGLVDSWYCRLDRPASLSAEAWRPAERFQPERRGTHFAYDADEFTGQFLERLRPVAAVEGDGWRALVEDGDTVLLVEAEDHAAFARAMRGLAARAAARGRTLACYTTLSERRDVLGELGFALGPGAFTMIPPRRWTDWNLESGDRL